MIKRMGLALVFIAMLVQGCTSYEMPVDYTVNDGVVLLDKEGTISDGLCQERGLDDQIIVLESKYCGACQEAVPKLEELARELKVEITFLDLSNRADSLKMNGFKVQPYYTPTMLVGCDVYVGAKSKEAYRKIISDFLE